MVTLASELTLPRWAVKALWRLHERDSGIAGPDVYGAPSSWPYGKVAGLEPDLEVITETTESPYVCCGYCSTAMACWTAREGLSVSMFNEAHDIRAAGGRGHNSGSNATELRNGASRALDIELEALATSEIRGQLEAGYAVSAALQYADLPDYLKVQGGDFGHGVCLYGYKKADDLVGYFDPLWPQGSQGAWARWRDLEPSLWSDGNHSTTVTRWPQAPTRGADMAMNAAAGLRSDYRARIAKGVDWYEDANLAVRGGSMSSDADVVYVAAPIGEMPVGGSYAVVVNTGNLYGDGSVRPSIVYVAAIDADTYSAPPPSPDIPPATEEAIEIRDSEWRERIIDQLSPGTFEG